MATPTYLNVTLKLMALYAGVMGSLTLMFQDAGAFIFQMPIRDPVITRYWGAVLMAFAIFYLFLSMDTEKYRLFIWVGVFDLGFAMITTIAHISTKAISATQGIAGVVINPIFIVILLYGLAKKKEGQVVLTAGEDLKGKPEHELPSHLTGHHPLHRK